jgi:predicted lipid-binding transport protein (Tim44 family)
MFSRTSKLGRIFWLSLVAAASLGLMADLADARVGGGRSAGSRGGKTFTAPPSTNTAPKPAAPMERSMTQPGKSTTAQGAQSAPTAAAQPSRFGGWKGLLLGGLIGAGLASMFGMGALASVLGFLLQAALIAGLVYLAYLAFLFFRNRSSQPALATATASSAGGRPNQNASNRNGALLGGGAASVVSIGQDDFDAFERLLGDIQTAYGRNDLDALGDRATPEMLSYFAEELDADAKRGVRNEVSGAKLLQGDLAEAWSEPDGEYATVAMRYSLIDATVETASGRVVSGSRTEPQEVTEVWTFRRSLNGAHRQWELSAIQQA